jgi:hypothetical protein
MRGGPPKMREMASDQTPLNVCFFSYFQGFIYLNIQVAHCGLQLGMA